MRSKRLGLSAKFGSVAFLLHSHFILRLYYFNYCDCLSHLYLA